MFSTLIPEKDSVCGEGDRKREERRGGGSEVDRLHETSTSFYINCGHTMQWVWQLNSVEECVVFLDQWTSELATAFTYMLHV